MKPNDQKHKGVLKVEEKSIPGMGELKELQERRRLWKSEKTAVGGTLEEEEGNGREEEEGEETGRAQRLDLKC